MSSIDHYAWDRPENIWANNENFEANWQNWHTWWQSFYFRRRDDKRSTRDFFKAVLGRQDTTVVFRHRNWVWCRPGEGWCLYVDKRGPSLHVRRGMTPDEATAAFANFGGFVELFLG